MYLDKQAASAFHSQPFPNHSLDKASLHMTHLSTHLTQPQATCCHTEIKPKLMYKHVQVFVFKDYNFTSWWIFAWKNTFNTKQTHFTLKKKL